jgi:hypothetical protein
MLFTPTLISPACHPRIFSSNAILLPMPLILTAAPLMTAWMLILACPTAHLARKPKSIPLHNLILNLILAEFQDLDEPMTREEMRRNLEDMLGPDEEWGNGLFIPYLLVQKLTAAQRCFSMILMWTMK